MSTSRVRWLAPATIGRLGADYSKQGTELGTAAAPYLVTIPGYGAALAAIAPFVGGVLGGMAGIFSHASGLTADQKTALYQPVAALHDAFNSTKPGETGKWAAIELSARRYNTFLGDLETTKIFGGLTFGSVMDAGDVASFADWGQQCLTLADAAHAKYVASLPMAHTKFSSSMTTPTSRSSGSSDSSTALVIGGGIAAVLALLFFL